MKEMIMYKCDYCEKVHESKKLAVLCEKKCKEQLECIHEKISNRFLYSDDPEDYICRTCGKTANKYTLLEESKERRLNQ